MIFYRYVLYLIKGKDIALVAIILKSKIIKYLNHRKIRKAIEINKEIKKIN